MVGRGCGAVQQKGRLALGGVQVHEEAPEPGAGKQGLGTRDQDWMQWQSSCANDCVNDCKPRGNCSRGDCSVASKTLPQLTASSFGRSSQVQGVRWGRESSQCGALHSNSRLLTQAKVRVQ